MADLPAFDSAMHALTVVLHWYRASDWMRHSTKRHFHPGKVSVAGTAKRETACHPSKRWWIPRSHGRKQQSDGMAEKSVQFCYFPAPVSGIRREKNPCRFVGYLSETLTAQQQRHFSLLISRLILCKSRN